jgi:RNA polymerase sigma factor (TIGR02999 family)
LNHVTRILSAIQHGDRHAPAQLLPLVYQELRELAAQRFRHEKPGHSMQATALVHEAYLRLVDCDQPQQFNGRGHFFAAAAEAMRRILIEDARRKKSLKAGGEWQRVDAVAIEATGEDGGPLDLLALDEALKKLEAEEPRKAEVVKLRFFGGLTNDEAADMLGVSRATVENDWAYARAWLRLHIDGSSGG